MMCAPFLPRRAGLKPWTAPKPTWLPVVWSTVRRFHGELAASIRRMERRRAEAETDSHNQPQ